MIKYSFFEYNKNVKIFEYNDILSDKMQYPRLIICPFHDHIVPRKFFLTTYTKPLTECLEPTVCYRKLANYTTLWGVNTLLSVM